MTVARHTAFNLAGAAVPLLVALVTVPLYVRAVGLDRYGILAICWLLLGYLNLFDLGLGRAAAQRIASLGPGRGEDAARVFWSALAASLAEHGRLEAACDMANKAAALFVGSHEAGRARISAATIFALTFSPPPVSR